MGNTTQTTPPDGQGSVRGTPQFDPEILPPDQPGYAPHPPVRRRGPTWAAAPATYLLLGINCAVFLAMTLRGVNIMSPSPDQLLHNWGANNAGYVLFLGQWWRIITAMFVHV